MPNFRSFSPQ
ncbi:hypothetical protein AYI69_g11110, partial [Smittium culicis]